MAKPSTTKKLHSWSYSRLVDFETCRFMAWLKHGERVPDPRPRPAADRGTAIHTLAENHVQVKGVTPLPTELKKFDLEFQSLQRHYHEGRVSLEGEWGFDSNWKPTSWKTAWARIKADAVIHLTPHHAAVIDYKTGRKWGNEVKHGEQLQLYTLAVFIREPQVQMIDAELWYLDQDDLSRIQTYRQQALNHYLKQYDRRGRLLTECTEWSASPSQDNCKWCPYGPEGTGHCKVGFVPKRDADGKIIKEEEIDIFTLRK